MPSKHPQYLAAMYIPKRYRTFEISHREQRPVWAECNARNVGHPLLSVKGDCCAAVRINQRSFLSRDSDEPTIRAVRSIL